MTIIPDFNQRELLTIQTREGKIIGGEEFSIRAIEKFDRRKFKKETLEAKRIDEYFFEPPEKVYHEFKSKYGIDIYYIDTRSYTGKRQRGELLVNLKDRAGLKYSEIKKILIFCDVKLSSLGRLYKDAKARVSKIKK